MSLMFQKMSALQHLVRLTVDILYHKSYAQKSELSRAAEGGIFHWAWSHLDGKWKYNNYISD